MCDLMLRRRHDKRPSRVTRNAYQATELGRCHGDSLLTELLPYPHPNEGDWRYDDYGRYANREAYERTLLPRRIELLRTVLREGRRDLVVCYGKSKWCEFRKLFDDAIWCDHDSILTAKVGTTRILLTHHFSRAFGPESNLARLATLALAHGADWHGKRSVG